MNKHLHDLMEGLTAKVFRTYNASRTLQEQLDLLTNGRSCELITQHSIWNLVLRGRTRTNSVETNRVKKKKLFNKGRKEGNVLFNDALGTFYLRLYGVGHMVTDLSDSERGEREKCFI